MIVAASFLNLTLEDLFPAWRLAFRPTNTPADFTNTPKVFVDGRRCRRLPTRRPGRDLLGVTRNGLDARLPKAGHEKSNLQRPHVRFDARFRLDLRRRRR